MSTSRLSTLLFLLSIAFLYGPNGLSLAHAQHVDFTACYNDEVLTLNVNDTSDPLQCFRYQYNGNERIRLDYRPYLSLLGCHELCGRGYQLWPASDTLKRFGLYFLPLILLAGRYAYAPYGAGNVFATFLILLGDPIDALWSMMTRQEVARRYYTLAIEAAHFVPKDVAAIWTAYDQWWQEPSSHFIDHLVARAQSVLPSPQAQAQSLATDILDYPVSLQSTDGVRDASTDASRTDKKRQGRLGFRWFHKSVEVLSGIRPTSTVNPVVTPVYVPVEDARIPDLLTRGEVYRIMKTAHELAGNRDSVFISSWLAILAFFVGLSLAYYRTATAQATNQTSHTLAAVTLFAFFVFAVYLGGHVGNFKAQEEVMASVSRLSKALPHLFPPVSAPTIPRIMNLTVADSYARSASWAGINNSWRPNKRLKRSSIDDRSPWLLLTICVWVVLVSWAAAFTLSFLTPLKGLGCRSGSWTLIMFAWLISFLLDAVFGCIIGYANAKQTKRLWRVTLIKNFIVAMTSIVLIFAAQIGLMNTCWCRASDVIPRSPASVCIDLGPVTPQQRDDNWLIWLSTPISALLLILAAIFVTGLNGENGRMLYTRARGERQAEAKALKSMKTHRPSPASPSPPATSSQTLTLDNGVRQTEYSDSPDQPQFRYYNTAAADTADLGDSYIDTQADMSAIELLPRRRHNS